MKAKNSTATLDLFPPMYVNVWFNDAGHLQKIDEHYYHEEKKAAARNRRLTKGGYTGMVVRRLVNWIEVPEARNVGD